MTRSNLVWLSAAWIAALAALTIFNGPSLISAPTDVFVLLDGALRLHLGQVPHVDFSNAIGDLPFALVATGIAIGGVHTNAIVIGCSMFLLIVGPWAALIAFPRLNKWLAFGFVLFVAVMCVATRPLGYDPTNHSYAMLYNRYGWILLSLLTLQAFVPVKAPSRRVALLEALSLGLLAGLLIYTKITYGAVGVAAIVLALVFRKDLRTPNMLAAMAGGIALVALGDWLAFGATPLDYVRDISSAAGGQSWAIRIRQTLRAVLESWFAILTLSAVWVVSIGRFVMARRTATTDDFRVTLQFGFLGAASVAIAAFNAPESSNIPLYVVAAFVLLYGVAPATDALARRATGAVALIAVLLMANTGLVDLYSVVHTTITRQDRIGGEPASQRITAGPLAEFVVPASAAHETQYWVARDLPSRLNDGLALLRPHVTPQSRVFNIALTNPYSFALGLTPPRGGLLWWDRNYSYNPEAPPAAETVFAEVTLIMIPRLTPLDTGCCREPSLDLPVFYGPYIREHFQQIDQSEHWTLLERRPLTSRP